MLPCVVSTCRHVDTSRLHDSDAIESVNYFLKHAIKLLIIFKYRTRLFLRYWLFRSWGRIGTTIGGSKVEKMKDLDNALDRFQALYEEKTENRWKDRNNFVKVCLVKASKPCTVVTVT